MNWGSLVDVVYYQDDILQLSKKIVEVKEFMERKGTAGRELISELEGFGVQLRG
jgi:hypothetical protein